MALPLAEAFTARSLGVLWNNYEKTLGAAPYLGRQKFGPETGWSFSSVSSKERMVFRYL